ncbi:AAA family ATPase [Paraburkholderia unamae]|uniref:histidine kinase n=1 Tax=Paraburkholderia unamae TaxID=219649 RepID=A0ABX5KVK4_9BURK|nr:AAA family ATPase [Paraburkholderia unamae]PVX85913.1 putative ATPase [Paraburkholderia unamae]
MPLLEDSFVDANIPGWDATGAAETLGRLVSANVLYSEDGIAMYRVVTTGAPGSILVKCPTGEPPPREALWALEKEHGLRAMIGGDWGIQPRDLFSARGQFLLVLTDCGGWPLANDIAIGRPLKQFLPLAVSLATTVKRLHERGLVHNGLNPVNAFVGTDNRIWLTGLQNTSSVFDACTSFDGDHAIATGALPYLAPERIRGTSVHADPRSDLYALGILLYQLLSGQLPYDASEREEWLYAHLVSSPRTLKSVVPDLPPQIDFIINKLLSKAVDDRYQTAAGVESDLQLCMEDIGQRADFPTGLPGRGDRRDRVVFPETSYGRRRELAQLHCALEQVQTSGQALIVVVEGAPGVGKTFFIEEFKREIGAADIPVTLGKFDQYNDNLPYGAFVQMLRGLVRPLLGKSGPEIAEWRRKFEQAIGQNGQLIVNLVPEIESIVGPQMLCETLPAQEATNRFVLVVRRFLNLFADPQRALVLFLDDVQWLDAGTLEIMDGLSSDAELGRILVVLAYRDQEHGASRVTSERLERLLSGPRVSERIRISPLAPGDVQDLIAHMLDEEPDAIAPLSTVIFEKTGGNPFFTIEFLRELIQERLVVPHPLRCGWNWDLSGIAETDFTDNVVDLLTLKLTRLRESTKQLLAMFACVGGVVSATALARMVGEGTAAVVATMSEAESAGLVSRKGDSYRFVHDRIQEASYASLSATDRERAHGKIGKNLLANLPATPSTAEVFETVGHLNRAQARLTYSDQVRLAVLNIAAGRSARSATAWGAAREYFTHVETLVTRYGVEAKSIDVFDLLLELSECECLTGDFKRAFERARCARDRAPDILKRASALRMEIRIHTAAGDCGSAVATSLRALSLLNIDVWDGSDSTDVLSKIQALRQEWALQGVESLLERGRIDDPMLEMVIGVIVDAIPGAYIGDPALFPWLVLKATELCLTQGFTRLAGYIFVTFAALLVGFARDFELGVKFAEVALVINDRHGEPRLRGTLLHLYGNHVLVWRKPLRESVPVLQQAKDLCMEVGDFIYAGYIAFETVWQAYERGEDLNEVLLLCKENQKFAAELRTPIISTVLELERIFLTQLQGREHVDAGESVSVTGPTYTGLVESLREAQFGCGVAFAIVMQMTVEFLDGRFAAVVKLARDMQPITGTIITLPVEATFHFLRAFATLRVIDEGAEGANGETREDLRDSLNRLEAWAEGSPDNFGSRHALAAAEYARVHGDDARAEMEYERAISLGRAHGHAHYEAMALEFSAHFYAARGIRSVSRSCLRSARDVYGRWGAGAKTRHLEQAFSFLREPVALVKNGLASATSLGMVDVVAMFQLSQTVSSEIDLDKLVRAFVQIAIRRSGADRALLMLRIADEIRIAADAGFDGHDLVVCATDADLGDVALPLSVVRHVMRTREDVVIEDSAVANDFRNDDYVGAGHCRSLLCIPLLRHAELVGVLYMENRKSPYVFDIARVNLMNMLAAQAAISIENARLYTELKRENAERRETEARLRRSEAFLEEGQRISKTGTWIWNATTGVMLWSRQNYELWGVDADCRNPTLEMCAQRVQLADQLRFKEEFSNAIRADATHSAEFSVACGNDETRRLHLLFRPWPNSGNGSREYIGSTIDVTDRRASENALCRSEMYLSEAQRLSNIGSVGWNIESREMTCSAQTYRILEADEPAHPRLDFILERIHPDDVEHVKRALQEAEEDAAIVEVEYRAFAASGVIKYLRMVARPVESAIRVVEYVGALADMTEIHQAQNALLRAQAELTHVTRVSTLGELTASIAHDLKQPLMAIITHGEAGIRWLDRAVPSLDEATANLDRIVNDANRASEVINRLRALARKERPIRSPIDMTQAVAEVVALVRQELERNRIRLRVSASESLPKVVADKIQIQQVVMNLVFNGLHSILRSDSENRVLQISAHRTTTTMVRVSVSDSGTGISAAIIGRLFEPFFTTKSDGMGLGLSICRSIIEEHRGTIWAFNNDDAGATLCFELPVGDSVLQ